MSNFCGLKPHGLSSSGWKECGVQKEGLVQSLGCLGYSSILDEQNTSHQRRGEKVLFDVLKTEGGGRKHHRRCADSWHGDHSVGFRLSLCSRAREKSE